MINGLIAQALNSSVSGSSKISPKPDIIRENGTYYATADELDGYSSVTVNVRKKYTTAEDAQSDLDSMAVTPTVTYNTAGGAIPVTFHATFENTPNQFAVYGYTTSFTAGCMNSETGEWETSAGQLFGQGIADPKVLGYELHDDGYWYCKISYIDYRGERVTYDQWMVSNDALGEDMAYVLDTPTIINDEE